MAREKKIGRAGGITIPADLRRDLGIQGGEKIDIRVEHDGSIRIKRIQGACIMCGSYENLNIFEKKFICQHCIEQFKKL